MKRERLDDDDDKPHLFKKGHERMGGRQKGQRNRMTILLKDAIITACEMEGDNREGRDGLIGYLRVLARREPAIMGRLLEKLLPMQITGKDGAPMQMVHTTREQMIERFKERGLPLPVSLIEAPFHRVKDVTPKEERAA